MNEVATRGRNEARTSASLRSGLAAEQGLDRAQTRKVIEAALKVVVTAAKDGAEVSLPGFGKFKVQDRPERAGRNPATGEPITVAASRKLGPRRPSRTP